MAGAANVYFRPDTAPVVSGYYGGAGAWADALGVPIGMPLGADTAFVSGFADQIDSTLNLDINAYNARLILSRKVQMNLNAKTYTVYGRTDLNTDARVTVAGGNLTTTFLNFLSTSPEDTLTVNDDAVVKVVNNSQTAYSVAMEYSSHLDVYGTLVCTGVNFGIGVDQGYPHMTIQGPKANVSANTLLLAVDSSDADKISGNGDLSISDGGKLSVSSLFYVGLDGVGTAKVTNGSSVTASVLSLGRGSAGTGTMLIDGTGTALHATTTDAGAMRIGRDGSGILNIRNGATVDSTSVELGYAATAAGVVNVDGEGSSLISTRMLAVGGSTTAGGGTGDLSISNGGLVKAAGQVMIWKKGKLTLDGGVLDAGAGCLFNGPVITGSGRIAGGVCSAATTYTPGALTIDGAWTLSASDSLQVRMHKDAEDSHDAVSVSGPVTLNGAKLDLESPAALKKTRTKPAVYVILDNTGDQPIGGTFAGIEEGAVIQLGADQFTASYCGGDGNDFTLTTVAVPVAVSWREGFFADATSSDADDNADPDHDMISNFWERAYGLDPLACDEMTAPLVGLQLKLPPPSSRPAPSDEDGESEDEGDGSEPVISTDPPPPLEGFLTLTYRRNTAATDLTFQVKWSDDLATWSADGIDDQVQSTVDGVEIHEAKIPVAPPGQLTRYLRLEVTSPDPH